MGEVYAARDTRLGRRVALKVLPERFSSDPQRLERFKREAQVLAALNHPNIGAIHGVEESDAVLALVLELIEGPTLADRITRGPIPPAEALPLAHQIASALESAHDQGIIHRDLKPSNIKLRPDGTVKVLDFGLAKALDPARGGTALDEDTITMPMDRVIGTAAYMSPEQARGQAVDKRADIWAFGCVVYEMVTGQRAFGRADTSDTMTAVIGLEPDWAKLPPGLPPVLQACLRACLRKDPKQRLHDIGDVRLTLEGAFDIAPGAAEPQAPVRWRGTLAWSIALVAVCVATGMIAWTWRTARDERPITFVLHPPDGSQFEFRSMAPMPALSPDGRHLAFVALRNSTPVLWVQTVGEPAARPLAGTEDALFPFWSPDGHFVGFAARGRLQKIAVAGERAPQALCTCDARFGGAWSADGTIVFAGRSAGLSRVSEDGGAPAVLTLIDQSLGESSHRYPVLLPDGRRFLYLIRGTQETHRGLYLGALDDPGLKRELVPDDSNGAIGLGPGGRPHLFFVRDLDLLAQPFDLSSTTLTGDPVVIARSVIPGEGGRFAPFAVGGRSLVYRRREPTQTRLVWMDRRGGSGGTVGVPGEEYWFPALSPDGTRLAVARRDPRTYLRDIWLMDIAKGTEERLTEDPVFAGFPLWMDDSTRIVFASARSGEWHIYSQSANGVGRDASPIDVAFEGSRYPRDITRDGRFLLFGGLNDLWMQPLDVRSQPRLLVAAAHGRVSRDGRWLAYTSTDAGARQVYVTTFPTPTGRWRISTDGGEDPQWSRDGTELYFVAGDQSLMAVDVRNALTRNTFANVRSEILFRVSFDRASLNFGSAYSAAPDGKRFLVLENLRNETPSLTVTINWAPSGPEPR